MTEKNAFELLEDDLFPPRIKIECLEHRIYDTGKKPIYYEWEKVKNRVYVCEHSREITCKGCIIRKMNERLESKQKDL